MSFVRRTTAWFSLTLTLSACGPGSLGAGDKGEGETGSLDASSSSSESETTTGPDPDDTDTDTDTDTDPDPTFVPDHPPCFGGFKCQVSCDPILQDCPDGEKCAPYASGGELWDATKCVPVLGDLAPGEACSYDGRVAATDDCDASSICYDGICRPFCTGSHNDPSCPAGFGCTAGPESALSLCLELCDPLAQDCTIGSCYWHTNHFLCNPTGDVEIGEPCGYFVNDCSPESACVGASALPGCIGSSCCSPLCDLDQPDCASLPGTECVAWFEAGQAPVGLEHVGVCLIP